MSFTASQPARPVTAVVLAGGDSTDPLAAHFGVPSKSFVPVNGRPLADWVLSALSGSSAVDRIVWLGELPAGLNSTPAAVLPSGRLFSDSVALGLGAGLALAPGSRLLICTGDLPWLTAEGVDDFISRSAAALNYPVIPGEVALKAFPDQKRTFVRLRQGQFTGGNLALLEPAVVPDLLLLTDRFFRARKNPLALSSLVGLGTLIDLLRGRADLPVLEERVSRLLGHEVRAVVSEFAGLGADVDRPAHLPAG